MFVTRSPINANTVHLPSVTYNSCFNCNVDHTDGRLCYTVCSTPQPADTRAVRMTASVSVNSSTDGVDAAVAHS